jgi:hypothetical protein
MMWDKIKAWFKHSVTILWARVLVLFGIIAAAISNVGGIDIFHGAISDKVWPWVVASFGVITELARRRTAGKI